MEHFLSLGLIWLQEVVMASTYKERYELLAPNLAADWNFLDKALSEPGWHALPVGARLDDLPISEMSEAQRNAILQQPIMVDPDGGPESIWLWAFAENILVYTYYEPEHEKYRQRGYVMFDYDRLCEWDAFHPSFDRFAANEEREAERLGNERLAEKYALMDRSQEERTKVWLRDGTGWWNEGDESKLVWSDGYEKSSGRY